MIRLKNVTKVYGDNVAVDRLSMEIEKGECVVLVGPSGCGKTTTLKMINRLVKPTKGEIYMNGINIAEVDENELRRSIGYVIQEVGLFPHMTIAENVGIGPTLAKWSKKDKEERIDALLELVKLPPEDFKDRYPRELSGGQKQRVGVARALGSDPPIMLMDEPFGALDPLTREKLQHEFLKIQQKVRKTVVFVTHDIDEALRLGNRIAIMRRGRLVQYSTPKEVLQHPKNGFVKNFVGADSIIKVLKLTKVKDVMIKDVDTAPMTQGVAELNELMLQKGIESLLVVDDNGGLKGIVWIDDIKESKGDKIGEVMDPEVETIEEGENLKDALMKMMGKDVNYLAVVNDEGKLRGLIKASAIHKVVREGITEWNY